jgi:hypothetical protein
VFLSASWFNIVSTARPFKHIVVFLSVQPCSPKPIFYLGKVNSPFKNISFSFSLSKNVGREMVSPYCCPLLNPVSRFLFSLFALLYGLQ